METLQRTANRGSISTGYDIENSLKFEEDNSENITTTNQAAGDRKTWTFSAWIKRTDITYDYATIFGAEFTIIKFLGDDRLGLELYNGTYYSLITTQKFRDTSAWYHIVAVCDTTQATASERSKLYVNGERVTVFDTENSPPLNSEFAIGQAGAAGSGAWLRLGQFFAGSDYFSGYMAEVHYLNGTAAQASDFGEYDSDSGIWIPKEYTGGGYGTQGFYYKFDNSANLGEDSSGEGHDANSINNITAADQATDTPTNNFATLNPLVQYLPDGAYSFITEGATKARSTQFDVFYTYASTFGVTSGKWYAEFEYEGSQADNLVGILDIDAVVPYNSRLGQAGAWSVGFYQSNGTLYVTSDSGVTSTPSWGASAADGDIISVALDMDNYFVYFAKNGTWQNSGVPTSGATGTGGVAFDSNKTVGIGCSTYALSADGIIFTNLGGYTAGTISSAATDQSGYGTFEYAPPTGYYALCTKNLAEYG